jgi:hypothetical protein
MEMTALIIDTGAPAVDLTHGIPDWFQDEMPPGTTPERMMPQFAYNLIGKLGEYKSADARRKCLLAYWPFLQRLAAVHPDIFDELLSSYSEAWLASM